MKTCYYGDTKHPTLKVALVGDSIAGNWWAPLDQIATQEHWELITELHATCPGRPPRCTTRVNKGAYPACHQWGVNVLHDLITTIRPDVVITSELGSASSLAHPPDSPQSSADVGAGMATYWKDLQAHGIGVIAIQETPNMGSGRPGLRRQVRSVRAECAVPRSQGAARRPAHQLRRQRRGRHGAGHLHELADLRPRHVLRPWSATSWSTWTAIT